MTAAPGYGVVVARSDRPEAHAPAARAWDRLFEVPTLTRELMLRAVTSPDGMRRIGAAARSLGMLAARIGLDRPARSGVVLCRDLEWMAGAVDGFGGRTGARVALDAYLNQRDEAGLGIRGRLMKLRAAVRADHDALRSADAKYVSSTARENAGILSMMVQRIGFQMMVAYRVMRFFRGAHLGLLARVTSRMMRHLYAADIHWDAELEPGVIIVHGVGLVISGEARVGAGSILFQHVTLGLSIDAESRRTGAPSLESNVHVGPGAVLLGPIVVGRGTKVMANAVLMRSIPPGSRVETPEPQIHLRDAAGGAS